MIIAAQHKINIPIKKILIIQLGDIGIDKDSRILQRQWGHRHYIYGLTDWEGWLPVGDKNKTVLSDMDCSLCCKKGCSGSGRKECL